MKCRPFDGIGANEYIVGVTHELVDFISTVDTPYAVGTQHLVSHAECGISNAHQRRNRFSLHLRRPRGPGPQLCAADSKLDYRDWAEGIREGRNYVSDGKSHLIDFKVNDAADGRGLERTEDGAGGRGARSLRRWRRCWTSTPTKRFARSRYDQKPYWDLERSRIGDTRKVPLELIVNGQAVARQEIAADGQMRDRCLSTTKWTAAVGSRCEFCRRRTPIRFL